MGLIQYWVDAFKDKPQLSAVQEVYAQLRDEGVEFPPLDLDSFAPIDTPDRVRTTCTVLYILLCRGYRITGNLR